MRSTRTILFNTTFFLNCLLAFLLLFENRLMVPAWLQVAGRMHPLVLHFPIVLLVLCIFWELFMGFRPSDYALNKPIGDGLLIAAALASVVTALMGLFLSREDGYTPGVLVWHKWAGASISFLLLAWYGFRQVIRRRKMYMVVTAFAGMVVIVITGHQGANITHGENFLLAPVMQFQKAPVPYEQAVVYNDVIEPILQQKCMNCHNATKAKGQLVMETSQLLLKGGKSGVLWDTTEQDLGLLLRRIHLPDGDKKHMPPAGKPALTDDEKELLYQWISSGAPIETRLADLPLNDSLRMLAAGRFQSSTEETYDFDAASDDKIKALNSGYRVVQPLATGSPALTVTFFGASKYNSENLKELLAVKQQVVSLNLNKMPVTDGELTTVAQFINLRKLNLSFTNLTGTNLPLLSALKDLQELSLSGTAVDAKQVQVLAKLPKLKRVELWKTRVKDVEIARLQKQFPTVQVERGFAGDTTMLTLTAPVIENEEVVLTRAVPLNLKHYINGVVIRYTLDGTEPDSLHSAVYHGRENIDQNCVVKARAFRPGWHSSPVAQKSFFKSAVKVDTLVLTRPPNPEYIAFGSGIIADGEKGSLNFKDTKWLGFKENAFEALLSFNNPGPMSVVTVSQLVDINSYIMPAQSIEVWGGEQAGKLRLLKRLSPEQPASLISPFIKGYDVAIAKGTYKYLKLVVVPVAKLPAWHRGKGDKAWVFVDEVFIN